MRRLWWAFLRLFFRLLYNEFACTYDLVAWVASLGQWNAWGRTKHRMGASWAHRGDAGRGGKEMTARAASFAPSRALW